MIEPRVIIVMLRQPRRSDPNEMRTDPMWEFGSFGCTGCHGRNLMHLRRLHELDGVRLAFAQNGPLGVKLVLVTPPVATINHGARGEATWSPQDMPLAYEAAPTLASNYRVSDCPTLMKLIDNAGRSTPVAKFASSFRTRKKPLPGEVGRELVTVFDRFRSSGAKVAQTYIDALPYPPPCIDDDRKETYHRGLQEAETGIRIDYRFATTSRCAPRRAQRA